jgi:glycosyltransferase involved in cell wall biosynthesis
MKVLHINAGKMYGGIETALITFARERRSCADLRPHFAFCFDGRFSRELRATGAPVDYLGEVRIRRPFTILRARAALDRLLSQESIDVVICHTTWTEAIFGPVVRQHRIPLVFWAHGLVSGRSWLEHWARLTRPDLTICSSRTTEISVKRLYPDISIARVNYPVSPPPFGLERDLESGQVVIVQVSRMERWKGHLLHLDALARLKDVPNWACWIIGGAQNEKESAYERHLHETCRRLGLEDRVEFLGSRDDVPGLLAQADIFCHPNLGPEPFGIVVIEALYAGLPVVATDSGGAAEIVTPECGVLVPENDPEKLSQALRALVQNREMRERLSAACPVRALSICDPARQINTLHQVLQALL